MSIKAVIFDFDGTLTKPGSLDFSIIRKEINCPVGIPVLEFIEQLKPDEQKIANDALERFETEGAKNSSPNDGAEELIHYLKDLGVKLAVVTRNSTKSVDVALKNFNKISHDDFSLIISRDEHYKPKPDPESMLAVIKKFAVLPEETLVVGDYIFDIQAGERAGALTVFLDTKSHQTLKNVNVKSDYTISSLPELKKIIRYHSPLPNGKLPNDLLQELLGEFQIEDPTVIIGPKVGEDTAAIEVKNEDIIIIKSDPITFPTDQPGYYSVIINSNDVVTSGAKPRWMMTTLLFPNGSTPYEIKNIVGELRTKCSPLGISLCGGHTEITDAVNRPVVSGMIIGTVKSQKLIRKDQMKEGDIVLLTKRVAVEGTAIIATEFAKQLHDAGMDESKLDKCRALKEKLSVIPEASIALKSGKVTAMHDVTEGGIATALVELAIAGKHNLDIHLDRIPYYEDTKRIGEIMKIDPLGLIGSGSLIICCDKDSAGNTEKAIAQAGIDVARIGEVGCSGKSVKAFLNGNETKWPNFETDELTKLF